MSIVIHTTTFYKRTGDLRYRLACETVRAATAAGHPIVIVDGSPDSSIKSGLERAGAKVFPELEKGMGPSRRQAFFHSLEEARRQDSQIILWMEPEKVDLIPSVPTIAEAFNGTTDIVVVGRKEAAWATYPAFQVETEKEANRVYNETGGLQGFDPMFGPVAFHVNAANHLLFLNPSKWGLDDSYIAHYAAIRAMRMAKTVVSLPVDFTYPFEQKREEDDNLLMNKKRILQRDSLCAAYRKLFAGQK